MGKVSPVKIKDNKADLKHLFTDWNAKQQDLKILKLRYPSIRHIIDQIVLKCWMSGAQLGANVQASIDGNQLRQADTRIKELLDLINEFKELADKIIAVENSSGENLARLRAVGQTFFGWAKDALRKYDDTAKRFNQMPDMQETSQPKDDSEGPSIIQTP